MRILKSPTRWESCERVSVGRTDPELPSCNAQYCSIACCLQHYCVQVALGSTRPLHRWCPSGPRSEMVVHCGLSSVT